MKYRKVKQEQCTGKVITFFTQKITDDKDDGDQGNN